MMQLLRLLNYNSLLGLAETSIQTYGGMLNDCILNSNSTSFISLGVLIWSCTFGALPFAKPGRHELSKHDIEQIKKAIADNQMPWTGMNPENPLLNQVLRVVKSCCNPRPDARPSAKQIEDQLRRIVNLGPLVSEVADPEDIKGAVSLKLKEKKNSEPLSEAELQALRALTTSGDGNAAYLLGLAIKEDLAPADDDVEQLLLVSETDGLKGNTSNALLIVFQLIRCYRATLAICIGLHGAGDESWNQTCRSTVDEHSLAIGRVVQNAGSAISRLEIVPDGWKAVGSPLE